MNEYRKVGAKPMVPYLEDYEITGEARKYCSENTWISCRALMGEPYIARKMVNLTINFNTPFPEGIFPHYGESHRLVTDDAAFGRGTRFDRLRN